MTLPLFDHQPYKVTGITLRDRGMKRVVRNTPPDFQARFRSVVEILPRGTLFTVETVRNALHDIPPEVHSNYFGAAMRSLARQNLIKSTGRMVNAERVSRHSGLLRQWERL